jgi:hypothetical protein
MPDMDALLLRASLGSAGSAGRACEQCGRTPLAGERLLELDSGRLLCELCFAELPEERRTAVRSERVRTGARRLAVGPQGGLNGGRRAALDAGRP